MATASAVGEFPTCNYLNSGGSVLQEWVTGQPRTNFMYAPGAGGPIFRADSAGLGEWYHYDAGGSVRAVSDASRIAQNTYAYDAFGVSTRQAGTGDNNRQFKGQQLDPTQLYFTGCGYYDPEAARLIGGCGSGASPAGAGGYSFGPATTSAPHGGGSGMDAGEANVMGQGLALDSTGTRDAGRERGLWLAVLDEWVQCHLRLHRLACPTTSKASLKT